MKLVLSTLILSSLLFSCTEKKDYDMEVSKNVINLKEMIVGQTYNDSILLSNTGRKTVRIISVLSPCDCTTVDYERGKIEPNDSLFLKINVTPNTIESFDKEIKIKTNIPEKNTYVIKLKGIAK